MARGEGAATASGAERLRQVEQSQHEAGLVEQRPLELVALSLPIPSSVDRAPPLRPTLPRRTVGHTPQVLMQGRKKTDSY
jgi:hypothetical protein